jgi:lipopolysaccharide/colanic/teichoic acid biosynthesis glycosyltransferase
MHFALTSIIFILLSTITIATSFADNVAFNESIIFSNTSEGSTSGIKNTDGEQTYQPYLADITRFIAIPIWTNHFITKALDMPILTVPQPAGIVLIGSAAFGLLIRFLRRRYHRLRPLVDYGISFIGLLIVSPIFLVVGIITKITSPGSIFYTQERVGKDNRLFNMIKFRTMHAGAESQTGPVWSKKNDARITGFGRFLRSTHLDELPQLINVLKGEMSIIGPRPERPFFVNKFKDEIHGYTRRLSIKPGITGLAQCYYKYDETIQDVRKKLSYDILYIKRMCWMLDLRILLKTLSVSLFGVRTS